MDAVVPAETPDASPGVAVKSTKSTGELILAVIPAFIVIGYGLFLLMLLFYQMQGYFACKDGVTCFRARVVAAGVFGMIVIVAPLAILCIFPGLRERLQNLWENSIIPCDDDHLCGKWGLLFLQATFFTVFLVVVVLPIESSASLVGITTEIRFRTDCMGGHLLDVTENLTYSIESGWTTKAQRVLYNQAEPTQFRAQWTAGINSVDVESVERKEPKKYHMSYESGQLTIVNLKFGQHTAVTNGTSFMVQLHYTARPYGEKDESERWWDVPNKVVGGKEVEQVSVIILGCTAPDCSGSDDTDWSVTTGAATKSEDGWQLTFQPPVALEIGSASCPLAWTLGSRNIWWVLTAVSLACAAMVCFGLAYGGSGDSAILGLCLICTLLACAMVFFMFAMLSDFWASDRAT